MKYINRVLLFVIACFAILFASALAFNHVNAWLGIGLGAVLFYAVLAKAVSFIKSEDRRNTSVE